MRERNAKPEKPVNSTERWLKMDAISLIILRAVIAAAVIAVVFILQDIAMSFKRAAVGAEAMDALRYFSNSNHSSIAGDNRAKDPNALEDSYDRIVSGIQEDTDWDAVMQTPYGWIIHGLYGSTHS